MSKIRDIVRRILAKPIVCEACGEPADTLALWQGHVQNMCVPCAVVIDYFERQLPELDRYWRAVVADMCDGIRSVQHPRWPRVVRRWERKHR